MFLLHTKLLPFLVNPVNMPATHNAAAYRLHNATTSKTNDGFCEDGEFGIGRIHIFARTNGLPYHRLPAVFLSL